MGLSEKYLTKKLESDLQKDVPDSMWHLIKDWLETVPGRFDSPTFVIKRLQNLFDIESTIPYTNFGVGWSQVDRDRINFVKFFGVVRINEPDKFFILIDYLLSNYLSDTKLPEHLEYILSEANHEYQVKRMNDSAELQNRLSDEDNELFSQAASGDRVYNNEFVSAFKSVYSKNKDFTKSAQHSFKALESVLKLYLGLEHKNSNLGKIYRWLEKNQKSWSINNCPEGLDVRAAQSHFLINIHYINKSYATVKHGQANVALEVSSNHAQTMLRVVALLIYELENNVVVLNAAKSKA